MPKRMGRVLGASMAAALVVALALPAGAATQAKVTGGACSGASRTHQLVGVAQVSTMVDKAVGPMGPTVITVISGRVRPDYPRFRSSRNRLRSPTSSRRVMLDRQPNAMNSSGQPNAA